MQRNLGELIRKIRLEKKIGLRQMAIKVGISPGLLSTIETKNVGSIGYDKTQKLCEILELNFDEVLGMSNKIAPDVKEIILSNPKEHSNKIRNFKIDK